MNLKFYLRGLGIGILVTAIIMLVIAHQNSAPMTDEEVKMRAMKLGMIEAGTTLADINADAKETVAESEKSGEMPPQDIVEEQAGGSEPEDAVITPLAEPTIEPTIEPTEIPIATPTEEPIDPNINAQVDDHLDDIESKLNEADEYINNKSGSKKETPKPTMKPTPTVEPTKEPTKEPEKTKEPSSTPTPKVEVANNESNADAGSGKGATLVISKGESSYTVAKHLVQLGVIDDANSFDTYLCSTGVDRKIRTGTFEIPAGSSKEEIASIIGG